MSAVSFHIPGTPVPKARARAYVRNGHIAHYTPKPTARFESDVATLAKRAMAGREPISGPVALFVKFWLPVPASYSKKRTADCYASREMPAKRPDTDNLVKSVTDGCNGIVWRDDAQVVQIVAEKAYGANPGTDVRVAPPCYLVPDFGPERTIALPVMGDVS